MAKKSKLYIVDGLPHRIRRGILVLIPDEWFGKVTHAQTISKRKSKNGKGKSFKRKVQR